MFALWRGFAGYTVFIAKSNIAVFIFTTCRWRRKMCVHSDDSGEMFWGPMHPDILLLFKVN